MFGGKQILQDRDSLASAYQAGTRLIVLDVATQVYHNGSRSHTEGKSQSSRVQDERRHRRIRVDRKFATLEGTQRGQPFTIKRTYSFGDLWLTGEDTGFTERVHRRQDGGDERHSLLFLWAFEAVDCYLRQCIMYFITRRILSFSSYLAQTQLRNIAYSFTQENSSQVETCSYAIPSVPSYHCRLATCWLYLTYTIYHVFTRLHSDPFVLVLVLDLLHTANPHHHPTTAVTL